MRRVAVLLTAAFLPLPFALSQNAQPAQRRPTPAAARGLQGDAKLRYILKQLDLDKDQKDHADALIDIYNNACEAEKQNAVARIQEIRNIMVEIKDAETAGDKDKAEKLKQSLQDFRSGVVPEREFFESLEAKLKPEQKPVLVEVRARVEKNPDVTLTPADVMKAARDQKLTDEQNKKLVELQEALRSKQQGAAAADPAAQAKVLEDFIKDVRGILTPEQAAAFDKQIEKLRPDPAPAAPGAPVAPAHTQDSKTP